MSELSSFKEEVSTWTLASDVKFQTALAGFSLRLREKTRDLVDMVENLSNDVDHADVRLRNTFNEFLMLGNTQFIENVSETNRVIFLISLACNYISRVPPYYMTQLTEPFKQFIIHSYNIYIYSTARV
jgi:hypothetical protein